jgi:hypothetical protein
MRLAGNTERQRIGNPISATLSKWRALDWHPSVRVL